MNKDIPLNKRIIMALDVDDVDRAKVLINMLKDQIRFYKVGYQLFLKAGLDFIKWMKEDQDLKVMLDLKLFDIPRTVNAALNQVKDYADYITVHSRDIILRNIPEDIRPKILGVTVLTCFDDNDTRYETNDSVYSLVLRRIKHILAHKCSGIVMSGRELGIIEENNLFESYQKCKIVVPGVQIDKPRDDDQKRVVTIEDAFKHGADHVVIGRPIYQNRWPRETVMNAQAKIKKVLGENE